MAAPKYQVIERESLDGMLYLPGKASVITHFMQTTRLWLLAILWRLHLEKEKRAILT